MPCNGSVTRASGRRHCWQLGSCSQRRELAWAQGPSGGCPDQPPPPGTFHGCPAPAGCCHCLGGARRNHDTSCRCQAPARGGQPATPGGLCGAGLRGETAHGAAPWWPVKVAAVWLRERRLHACSGCTRSRVLLMLLRDCAGIFIFVPALSGVCRPADPSDRA